MTIKYVGVIPPESKVDKLMFSLEDNYGSVCGMGEYDNKHLELLDGDEDSIGKYVAYKDIDNMIEALKLAKELWGGTDSE